MTFRDLHLPGHGVAIRQLARERTVLVRRANYLSGKLGKYLDCLHEVHAALGRNAAEERALFELYGARFLPKPVHKNVNERFLNRDYD